MLTFAAPFALSVDWSVLDVAFRVVADQIVMQELKVVVVLEESDQRTPDLRSVRVNHLGKMTNYEAASIRLKVVQISLFGLLVFEVPLPHKITYDLGGRQVHAMEPLHSDALSGMPELVGVVALIVFKVATFSIVFR